MYQHDHNQATVVAAPRYFPAPDAEFDQLEPSHSVHIVWIRRRQYFLHVTVDSVTHGVLSYRLRGAPPQRSCLRKNVS